MQKLDVSPAYLRNDGNKYLNYTDDWYVLAQKPDEYAVIYYRGNNDAWKGYGGATVYTRCAPVEHWAYRRAMGVLESRQSALNGAWVPQPACSPEITPS